MTHSLQLEPPALVRLGPLIAAINPAYLASGTAESPYSVRIHTIQYTAADRRLYIIVADRFLFFSDDGCASLHEAREVNYEGALLVPSGRQWIDVIVDTLQGTVLVIGRDRREGTMRGVVWRKPAGEADFTRIAAHSDGWNTSKAGNATAGFFGPDRREMVALAIYDSPAHLYFSLDDGVSWQRQSLEQAFALHAHEVYLARAADPTRTARLWVTGGDDPSGQRSGVVAFDALGPDGGLAGLRQVLRERPGFRFVGLAGNGRNVYIGNESLAGGVLKLQDNVQSIDLQDAEYILGKNRHDYHQMRSLVATPDGILAAGTDSYGYVGDTIRADSGGYVYLSTDDGASFREIALGGRWITGLVCDDSAFWIAFCAGRENGPDLAEHRLTLLRLAKPSPLAELTDPYCAKVVMADSSRFYALAGYADHPAPELAPAEATFRVDMSRYREVHVLVESRGPVALVIEALPFLDWHPEEHTWDAVAMIESDRPVRRQVVLTGIGVLARHYRVRNVASTSALIRQIAFLGKR